MSSARPLAAVHVDLDGLDAIHDVHGWERRGAEDPLYESGLENALALFEAEGVRATLFVIARDLAHPRRLALVREALRRGHRVASHSLDHPRFDGLVRAERRRQIAESRARIADLLGVAPHGFRAPNFEIDREVLELVGEAGYSWDSSCLSGARYARRLGLASVPRAPFAPLGPAGPLELPLPAHAPLPVPFHPSYALVLGEWWFRLGLARFRRGGDPALLLFHLTDFADPLPAELLPRSLAARVFTLSHRSAAAKRAVCARILARLRESYEVVDTEDVVAAARAASGSGS